MGEGSRYKRKEVETNLKRTKEEKTGRPQIRKRQKIGKQEKMKKKK